MTMHHVCVRARSPFRSCCGSVASPVSCMRNSSFRYKLHPKWIPKSTDCRPKRRKHSWRLTTKNLSLFSLFSLLSILNIFHDLMYFLNYFWLCTFSYDVWSVAGNPWIFEEILPIPEVSEAEWTEMVLLTSRSVPPPSLCTVRVQCSMCVCVCAFNVLPQTPRLYVPQGVSLFRCVCRFLYYFFRSPRCVWALLLIFPAAMCVL